MCIADDGVGIDPEDLRSKPNSLGMKLLKGLSEDIGAELRIENDNGTKVTLTFSMEHYECSDAQRSSEPIEA
jgi:two-component sensor histidine kinase